MTFYALGFPLLLVLQVHLLKRELLLAPCRECRAGIAGLPSSITQNLK